MSSTRTVVVTGSASGMGAATKAVLEADGQRVIGVDQRDAEVIADLGTPEGRAAAIAAVTEASGGAIDGLVTWAGVPGLTHVPGSVLVSVNHFGTVALHEGLRPLLALGDRPAAVAISSNSTTCQPGVPMDVVQLCLDGDEAAARDAADAAGSLGTYPATKTAIAWWARQQATTEAWAGAGITLNVVAPGAVETPLLQASRDDPTIGQFIDQYPIPIGRKGTATELAEVVAFLLGPHARFFCGSVVCVDGGTDALFRATDNPTPWVP
ncbi:SDR family oxidoreductase [Aquihabitans sp. McL0605]|uniref:SDR family oxidoreductase n=1 Tax=Aquihabitans sp. McL0605 TaxID=3415671 RepID=UPI003CF7D3A5